MNGRGGLREERPLVVVVSGRRLLGEALAESLAAATGTDTVAAAPDDPFDGLSAEVVVIDGGGAAAASLDDTVVRLRSRLPAARLIVLHELDPVAPRLPGAETVSLAGPPGPLVAVVDGAAPPVIERHELSAPAEPARANGEVRLTERERDVVDLVVRGEASEEIARHLGISVNTVRTHLRNAMSKLGVRSRAQLVVLARGAQTMPNGTSRARSSGR